MNIDEKNFDEKSSVEENCIERSSVERTFDEKKTFVEKRGRTKWEHMTKLFWQL